MPGWRAAHVHPSCGTFVIIIIMPRVRACGVLVRQGARMLYDASTHARTLESNIKQHASDDDKASGSSNKLLYLYTKHAQVRRRRTHWWGTQYFADREQSAICYQILERVVRPLEGFTRSSLVRVHAIDNGETASVVQVHAKTTTRRQRRRRRC